jgi:hypothetical protein
MLQQPHDDSRRDSRDDALEELTSRLSAHLDCTQDVACRQILRALAESRQPPDIGHADMAHQATLWWLFSWIGDIELQRDPISFDNAKPLVVVGGCKAE